jgi:hypothetical protein
MPIGIHDRHDRPEAGVRPEEFVLRRRLADRDSDYAGRTGAFDTRKIAADGAKFCFIGVEIVLCRLV